MCYKSIKQCSNCSRIVPDGFNKFDKTKFLDQKDFYSTFKKMSILMIKIRRMLKKMEYINLK